jgi:hypothetical protein
MAAAVATMEQAIDGVARGLDPATITARDAMTLTRRVARGERQLAGIKMRLADRVAETDLWRHGGHRSAAHWLAGESGTSVAEAVGVLETGSKLHRLPATTAAVTDGALSRAQAQAVADAASTAPDSEDDLVALAAKESLKGLKDEAARRKTAHLDEHERQARIHASRHVRFGTDPDGAATLSARATTEAMAEIRAAITHFQNLEFETARAAGVRDPFEAYALDGLLVMARTSMAGNGQTRRVPTKVIIRVDATALARGHIEAGETCEATGAGPVTVAHVQQLLLDGDAFAAAVATDTNGRVTRVAHLGHRKRIDVDAVLDTLTTRGRDVTAAHDKRPPNAHQRSALQWTNPTCAHPGCDQPVQHIHHTNGWAKEHRTQLDHLEGLCAHHHRWHHQQEDRPDDDPPP